MASVEQPPGETAPKQRVPAAERRDALVAAAIEEFAQSGFYGTPVDRIARRVGVAQPYVFSLFATKRELFIAAVERCFERVTELFEQAAAGAKPTADACYDSNAVLQAIGNSYVDLLESDRNALMLQLQAYAACGDELIREHVRDAYARLGEHIRELSGANEEQMQEFLAFGMYLSVQAATGGVENLAEFKAERHAALERRLQTDA